MFQTEERVSAKALGQAGLDVLVGGYKARVQWGVHCLGWDS